MYTTVYCLPLVMGSEEMTDSLFKETLCCRSKSLILCIHEKLKRLFFKNLWDKKCFELTALLANTDIRKSPVLLLLWCLQDMNDKSKE